MIIDHTDPEYLKKWRKLGANKYNGAYYYSKEIVEKIIPNVKTNRNWITIKAGDKAIGYSIYFVHDNIAFEERNQHLKLYNDIIFVVGLPDMVDRLQDFGHVIYLPLSIDVDYVKQFAVEEKTKERAFIGRRATRRDWEFPEGTDFIEGMRRDKLLTEMAKYKEVYAIGRTALEAKVLGCDILPFHPRLPDVSIWKVLDCKDAADILQKELDKIDGR